MESISGFACKTCGRYALDEFEGFSSLPRVTSDCKPFPPGGRLALCSACGAIQKPADKRWLAEIDQIYRDYEIYFQSVGGAEQSVFDPTKGVPALRSRVLLDRVHGKSALAEQGRLIDVGCGRGAFLRAFSEFRPGWQLFGHELSPRDAVALATVPRFNGLYSGPLAALPRGFDVITLMHSLEHFNEPLPSLIDLRDKLNTNGLLIIEVPNATVSAFDLVVADHASHFAKEDLMRLFARAGLANIAISDGWITKELSAVGSPGEVSEPGAAADPKAARARVVEQLAWLREVLRSAKASAAQAKGKLGLFGTSVASMWLLGELGTDVSFFVDEDPGRTGTLHGRPVLKPDQVEEGAKVFLALIPSVAKAVLNRLGSTRVEWLSPIAE